MVPGLAAHIRGLEQISRNAAVGALKDASQLLASNIKAHASQLSGDLIKSIVVKRGRSTPRVVVSLVLEQSDHAVMVEYGTQSTPAQPHWRPGIAMSRDDMIRLIVARVMKAN